MTTVPNFEITRCMLILGYALTDEKRRVIREKEVLAPSITVRTYDELLRNAKFLIELMKTAGQGVAEGIRPGNS